MKYYYSISGITCGNCVKTVKQKLQETLPEATINIDLDTLKVLIEVVNKPSLNKLNSALPDKYELKEIEVQNSVKIDNNKHNEFLKTLASKLKNLKPLFLIFTYVVVISVLINWDNWDAVNYRTDFMMDFMGVFFVIFSFFKILDIPGFANAFRKYDPIARRSKFYAVLYPFIELLLGLLFLYKIQILYAVIATIIILGITTIGVIKVVTDKKEIQCACLGSVLKLKMTEATIIENGIMIIMGVSLIIELI